jgi:hypothetical protein
MSYRLITKATLTGATLERMADVRAYAAPKGASVGVFTLNGESTPFKLTGGQGRGTVVRCYMYFMLRGESAYIEISKDEMTELKTGNQFVITTESGHATQESPEGIEDLAPVEEAPKATRKSRKQAA